MATAAARAPGRASRPQAAPSWAPFAITDAEVWIALGVAMAIAAVLGLWLGRDTTFTGDEVAFFTMTPHLDFRGAIDPYNGHLIAIPRLIFAGLLHGFGADYVPVRVVGIASILLTAGLFFEFVRRRVGAVVALAPTLVLLFFGSDFSHSITGSGVVIVFPLAAGIGALLALDREDRRGDVVACLLLTVVVTSYSDALGFVAGAAVLLLLSPSRVRRAWVWLIPTVLYAAWLLWSHDQPSSSANEVTLSNLLLFPNWAANSLGTVAGALTGLNYPSFGIDWGPALALIAIVALVWRLFTRPVSVWLWALLAIPIVLWLIGAAAANPPARVPQSDRYMYPVSIAVLLVAAEAARGNRLGRTAVLIVYGIAALGVATNLALLRDGSSYLRSRDAGYRADLAAVDIAGGRVGPTRPAGTIRAALANSWVPCEAATIKPLLGCAYFASGYIDAVDAFGSPGFSSAELRGQDEALRDQVDADLADELDVGLASTSRPGRRCRREGSADGVAFEVPRRGAIVRTSGRRAHLYLRRFGSNFTVDAGTLPPERWLVLRAARGSIRAPWYATSKTGPLSLCSSPAA